MRALLDTGSQVCTILDKVRRRLGLELRPVSIPGLKMEGTGGFEIPYLGEVVVDLSFPCIKAFHCKVRFLVLPDTARDALIEVQIGTSALSKAIPCLTESEADDLDDNWYRAITTMLMSKSGTPHPAVQSKSANSFEPSKLPNKPLPVKNYKPIVILKGQTIAVKVQSPILLLEKRMNVVISPLERPASPKWSTVSTKTELKVGEKSLKVLVRNNTNQTISIPKKTTLGWMEAGNEVPKFKYIEGEAPNPDLNLDSDSGYDTADPDTLSDSEENTEPVLAAKAFVKTGELSELDSMMPDKSPTPDNPITKREAPPAKEMGSEERYQDLLEQIDFKSWDTQDQEFHQRVKDEVFRPYQDCFALHINDLGHCRTVKHKIKLTDWTPFKEAYRSIPPSQYDEVKQHIQEMVDCGAIVPSKSPFASGVVLARRKNGKLRFCID